MNDKLNVTKIFARNIQAGLLSKLFGAFVVFLTTPIIIDSLGNDITANGDNDSGVQKALPLIQEKVAELAEIASKTFEWVAAN